MYQRTVHLDVFILKAVIEQLKNEVKEHVPQSLLGFEHHNAPPAKGEKWGGLPVTDEDNLLLMVVFDDYERSYPLVVTLSPLIDILELRWLPSCEHKESIRAFRKAGIY